MRQNKKIRLSKSDSILKVWINYLRQTDINISRMVIVSIYYYVKTGEYAFLGTIDKKSMEENCVDINDNFTVYISDSKWFKEWNEEILNKDSNLSAEMKRIIKGGLSIGNATALIRLEELEKTVDSLMDAKRYVPPVQVKEQPVFLKQEAEIPVQPVQIEEPLITKEKPKKPHEEENIMSRLFMGSGFG